MKFIKLIFLITVLITTAGCAQGIIAEPAKSEPTSPLPPDENTLFFIGRASIRIEMTSGLIIYIDPYAGVPDDYKKEADLVLVTHQHSDHNKVNLTKIKENGKIIQCPNDIKSGDIMESNGIKIQAVDAYNKNHSKSSCCGFIITIDNLVIYHSGDTSTTTEMSTFSEYNITYAILCIDGYYNMGAEEAMDVSELINAKYIIPIHSAASGNYSQKNMDKFTLDNKIVLKPDESTTLKP